MIKYKIVGDEMKEQSYILENSTSFEPEQIFECGQCFRWQREEDRSYTGVFGRNVINVKKEKNKIIFTGICEKDIKELCWSYFDLERDYEAMKKVLKQVDKTMLDSISYGSGIRLLNQDIWETLISFIISANNNIPRIKKIIENLARTYGNPIKWKDKTYYTFPTPKQLEHVTTLEFRKLGLGFRDKYIENVTKKILHNEISFEELSKIKETEKLREKLMQFNGVGEKVADCVLLFSTLKRLDVFPIDVWVRRVMQELYFPEADEKSVDKKQIKKMAEIKFRNLSGLAQQYLFYWRRAA